MCPSRSRVCTSPDGQPVVAMMPAAFSAIISASIRDHLPSCPSNDASDDSLNRFRSPVAFSATIVMCVYDPLPETSSAFWLGSPHRTRLVSNRDPGAMYASTPMIGLMPPPLPRCRTRWHRTCFRGRSSRSPASPAAAPRRASARSSRHRPASSIRCGCAGARRTAHRDASLLLPTDGSRRVGVCVLRPLPVQRDELLQRFLDVSFDGASRSRAHRAEQRTPTQLKA